MTSEEFIERYSSSAPTISMLKSIGLNTKEAHEFNLSYVATKKISTGTSGLVNDELIRLVNNYNIDTLEIGMVRFKYPTVEDGNFYFVGTVELDKLAISQVTNEVVVISFEDNETIIYHCAQNSSKFLEGLLIASDTLNKAPFDDKYWEDQRLIYSNAQNSASAAGGEKYLGFFLMLLGYDG